MKKPLLALLTLFASLSLAPFAHAEVAEKVDLVKFDTKNHDMVVERKNGDRLLIQHSRVCSSMKYDFPVELLWNNEGDLDRVKVAFNEICKVYDSAPYDGMLEITKRIKSYNILVPDHQAEVEWEGTKYRIQYSDGCKWLRLYEGEEAYINQRTSTLQNAELYLPNHRGSCTIESVAFLEELLPAAPSVPKLKNVDYQAQTNQVYFYWDELKDVERPLYLISYSTRAIDPSEHEWQEMPNLKYTRKNTYTVEELANGKQYYFYLAAVDKNYSVSDWTHVTATPVLGKSFKNNPDEDQFEIEIIEETDEYFKLSWPTFDYVDRYMVWLFANGKPQFFDYQNENSIIINKTPELLDKGLRLAVRIVPNRPIGRHRYDGHFWRYEVPEH